MASRPSLKKSPEAFGIAHAAGKSTTDSHDSNGRAARFGVRFAHMVRSRLRASSIARTNISETFARTAVRPGSR